MRLPRQVSFLFWRRVSIGQGWPLAGVAGAILGVMLNHSMLVLTPGACAPLPPVGEFRGGGG